MKAFSKATDNYNASESNVAEIIISKDVEEEKEEEVSIQKEREE